MPSHGLSNRPINPSLGYKDNVKLFSTTSLKGLEHTSKHTYAGSPSHFLTISILKRPINPFIGIPLDRMPSKYKFPQ